MLKGASWGCLLGKLEMGLGQPGNEYLSDVQGGKRKKKSLTDSEDPG